MIMSKKLEALDAQIFFTSVNHGLPGLFREDRRRIRLKLVQKLVASMSDSDISGIRFPPYDDSDFDIQSNCLGKPKLKIRNGVEFAISFSYGPGRVWAAATHGNTNCGIDVAFPLEFLSPYPLERAFGVNELGFLHSVYELSEPEAACFIWSAKESIVKALGTGYNLCEPLDLLLTGVQSDGDYFQSRFLISPKLKSKLGISRTSRIETVTLREGDGFLSLSGAKGIESDHRIARYNSAGAGTIGLRQ